MRTIGALILLGLGLVALTVVISFIDTRRHRGQ